MMSEEEWQRLKSIEAEVIDELLKPPCPICNGYGTEEFIDEEETTYIGKCPLCKGSGYNEDSMLKKKATRKQDYNREIIETEESIIVFNGKTRRYADKTWKGIVKREDESCRD